MKVCLTSVGPSHLLRRCLYSLTRFGCAGGIPCVYSPGPLDGQVTREFQSRMQFSCKEPPQDERHLYIPGTMMLIGQCPPDGWERSFLLTVYQLPPRLQGVLDVYGANWPPKMIKECFSSPVQTAHYRSPDTNWGWRYGSEKPTLFNDVTAILQHEGEVPTPTPTLFTPSEKSK